jgi:hypothetical protein
MDNKEKIMRKINKKDMFGMFLIVAILLSVSFAISGPTPESPLNISEEDTSSRQPNAAQTLTALGGNLTQLNIGTITQTISWQGYYGNVTGTIMLGDASGNTIYNWEAANPSGQIYASTSQVSFADGNIECYNFSKSGGDYVDLDAYESSLNMDANSADGINETFNETTSYDAFYIGATYINSTCPTVYLFNSTNVSTTDTYQEVMLYDLTANDVIYTSIIKPGGIKGFNNLDWDFQMIVAEDGHIGDTTPTTYYFYVALE